MQYYHTKISMLAFVAVVMSQTGVLAESQQKHVSAPGLIGALVKPATPGKAVPAASVAHRSQRIRTWFSQYDSIRRRAEMTSGERAEADRLTSKGFFIVFSGKDRESGRRLLSKMIARYDSALGEMQRLRKVPETSRLHAGYTRYFANARKLFRDYLAVNNDVFAEDASGDSIRKKLKGRKAALTALEASNKALDQQVRAEYRIPAFGSRT